MPKGVQVGVAAGHSLLEVHRVMPVHAPTCVQTVWLMEWAKLLQPALPRPIVAPGAQHTGVSALPLQSTGSAHNQSV